MSNEQDNEASSQLMNYLKDDIEIDPAIRDEIMAGAMISAARREMIGKMQLVCPSCHSSQVQLISYFKPIIVRKCRICHFLSHKFVPMEKK